MTVKLNAFADQLPVNVFSARCLSFKLTTPHPNLGWARAKCRVRRTAHARNRFGRRQPKYHVNLHNGQTCHVARLTLRCTFTILLDVSRSGTTREVTRGNGRPDIIGRHSRATGVDSERAVMTSTMPHTTLTKCSFIQWLDQISINVVRLSHLRFISVVYNRTTTWATAHRVCASVSNTAMCVTAPQLFYHQWRHVVLVRRRRCFLSLFLISSLIHDYYLFPSCSVMWSRMCMFTCASL